MSWKDGKALETGKCLVVVPTAWPSVHVQTIIFE